MESRLLIFRPGNKFLYQKVIGKLLKSALPFHSASFSALTMRALARCFLMLSTDCPGSGSPRLSLVRGVNARGNLRYIGIIAAT